MEATGDRYTSALAGLQSEDYSVRYQAMTALSLEPALVGPLTDLLLGATSPRDIVAYMLSQLGEPGLQSLIAALDNDRPDVRGWAIVGLTAAIQDDVELPEDVVTRLRTLVDDPDAGVARAAASALRLLGEWYAAPTALDPAVYVGTVYADHHQFSLCDTTTDTDDYFDGAEDDEDDGFYRGIAQPCEPCVRLTTSTYGSVPVRIEVRETAPEDDVTAWDHVAEGSITLPSGQLTIWTLFDDLPTDPVVSVPPDTYRLRVYTGNLTTAPFAMDEDDYYRLVLWPGPYQLPVTLNTNPAVRRSDAEAENA